MKKPMQGQIPVEAYLSFPILELYREPRTLTFVTTPDLHYRYAAVNPQDYQAVPSLVQFLWLNPEPQSLILV